MARPIRISDSDGDDLPENPLKPYGARASSPDLAMRSMASTSKLAVKPNKVRSGMEIFDDDLLTAWYQKKDRPTKTVTPASSQSAAKPSHTALKGSSARITKGVESKDEDGKGRDPKGNGPKGGKRRGSKKREDE